MTFVRAQRYLLAAASSATAEQFAALGGNVVMCDVNEEILAEIRGRYE